MRAKLQSYLQEMNIPDRLLDAINAVGPQQTRWLSGERDLNELQDLWIVGRDPVWEDLALSRKARELDISKQELIKRSQQAQAQSGVIGAAGDSRSDIHRKIKCNDSILKDGHYP